MAGRVGINDGEGTIPLNTTVEDFTKLTRLKSNALAHGAFRQNLRPVKLLMDYAFQAGLFTTVRKYKLKV